MSISWRREVVVGKSWSGKCSALGEEFESQCVVEVASSNGSRQPDMPLRKYIDSIRNFVNMCQILYLYSKADTVSIHFPCLTS